MPGIVSVYSAPWREYNRISLPSLMTWKRKPSHFGSCSQSLGRADGCAGVERADERETGGHAPMYRACPLDLHSIRSLRLNQFQAIRAPSLASMNPLEPTAAIGVLGARARGYRKPPAAQVPPSLQQRAWAKLGRQPPLRAAAPLPPVRAKSPSPGPGRELTEGGQNRLAKSLLIRSPCSDASLPKRHSVALQRSASHVGADHL